MGALDRLEVKLSVVHSYVRRSKSGRVVQVTGYTNSVKKGLDALASNLTHDDGIRAAALKYNAAYPEAADEINAGQPVIKVILMPADHYGRWIRAVVNPGVILPDGNFAAASDPLVRRLKRFDGRLTKTEVAKRATKYLGVHGVKAQVLYEERGI